MMGLSVNIRRFRSQGAFRRKLPRFTVANLRIVQIGSRAYFEGVKVFQPGEWRDIEAYRPRVIAGTAAHLQELAERVELGVIELASVDHAIFVLTGCGDEPVRDVLRVVLWQTFGVPVYELFLGSGGVLAASECETHEGWHVEPGAAFSLLGGELVFDGFGQKRMRTGLSGTIEIEPCACGRAGMRLMNVERCGGQAPRAFAATA
jgi:phenylacetate-coenzyme A ligase PaaK-like adenylate-forming protein